MNDKELSDEELEAEFEKAIKTNESNQDNCGTALPMSKEVGIQRTDVKLKEKK